MCFVMVVLLLPATAETEAHVIAYITDDITTDTTWPAGDYYICKTADSDEPVWMTLLPGPRKQ